MNIKVPHEDKVNFLIVKRWIECNYPNGKW